MKLRFDKNSLRLRVKKSDLEKLEKDQVICEVIKFTQGALEYKLSVSEKASEVSAFIKNTFVEVVIPSVIAENWINSNDVGIYHTIKIETDTSLDIIIEKDFPCQHQSSANNSDSFGELVEQKRPGADLA